MLPTTGSCLCENIKISYTGEPGGKAICYCGDCRKGTGSAFSTNFMIPDENFTLVAGDPKTYTKKADSGNNITSFFCSNCGTILWREGEKFKGLKILKAGVLEGDEMNKENPGVELYTARRQDWLTQISGAHQHEGNM